MEVRGDPTWITLVLLGVAFLLGGYFNLRFDLFGRGEAKRRVAAGRGNVWDDITLYRLYFFVGVGALLGVGGIVVGVVSLLR